MPEPGDSVVTLFNGSPDIEITAAGGAQNWDWTLDGSVTQIVQFDTNDEEVLFPQADIKMSTAILDNYFEIDGDSWNLVGQQGADPFGLGLTVSTFVIPAEMIQYAPVAYQDSTEQVFDLFAGIPLTFIPDSILETLPLVPDSMRVRISTTSLDDVDAWGDLTINEGSVEVLRVKQTRRIGLAIEAKISILPWADVTGLLIDYLDILPFEIDLADTIVSYRFIAPGYVLPVATVTTDSTDMAVNSVTYVESLISSTHEPVSLTPFSLFPNPTSDVATLDMSELADAGTVRIYDVSGREVWARQLQGEQIAEISVADLASGLYLVSIWSNTGTLAGLQKLQVTR